jgi:hypothetical protein
MAEPPVPVLMLYDPEEFWAKVRATVREEMAAVHAEYNGFISALEKAGLPIKPAYTPAEITALFQLSEGTLEEWAEHGLLRLTTIGRRTYILYNDLRQLFHAP